MKKLLFVLFAGCLIFQNTQSTLSGISAAELRRIAAETELTRAQTAERQRETAVRSTPAAPAPSMIRIILTFITGYRSRQSEDIDRILANTNRDLEVLHETANVLQGVTDLNNPEAIWNAQFNNR